MAGMSSGGRRRRDDLNVWPGWVDALSSLVMVFLFVLMVFMVAQFHLTSALSGSEENRTRMDRQIRELSATLGEERRANDDLRSAVAQLSAQLQTSAGQRERLERQLQSLAAERDQLQSRLADSGRQAELAVADAQRTTRDLEDAFRVIEADREKIRLQVGELSALQDDIRALRDLRRRLEADIAALDLLRQRNEQEIAGLRRSNQESEAARARIGETLRLTAEERDTLARRIRDLSGERDSLATLLAQIRAESASLARQVEDGRTRQALLGDLLTTTQGDLQRAQADLSRTQAEIEAATRRLQETQAARDGLAEEIRQVRSQREAVIAELSRSETERKAAEEGLRLTWEERAALARQLQEVLERFRLSQAQLADAAEQRTDLEAQLATAEGRIQELLASLGVTQGRMGEQEAAAIRFRRQADTLSAEAAALREEIGRMAALLAASEARDRENQVQIANLGSQLNQALAGRVQELARYRSEFFGRLRDVVANQPDIRIVGDRFVFQSEVLFDSGSATLEDRGRQRIRQIAVVLKQLTDQIPQNVNWVLRVDGHTDRRPISTREFPSNWELSNARALSVVRFLIEQGIPADRLAATGFGEFQPLETTGDLARNRRIELRLDQR
jgi:chemotaxis protein MotB